MTIKKGTSARSGSTIPTDWITEYLEGATLDEVAKLANLSKQGAADHLRRQGVHVRTATETRELRERQAIARSGDSIKSSFLRTRRLEDTAKELGLSRALVKLTVEALVPDFEVLARVPRATKRRYEDEDLVASLREAANEATTNLTTAYYRQFTTKHPLLSDGRARPGDQVMLIRFGSWRQALNRAGLPANPHAGPDKQFKEGAEEAVDALVACWRDTGRVPSVRNYDQWQRSKPGRPSPAIARRRLGGSWDSGLLEAWQLVHGIPLPADDDVRILPPSEPKDDPLFESYTRADEDATISSSFRATLTEYTALERAVRSHARIQNLVADTVRARGLFPAAPSSSGPQFDIAFESAGNLVVVEVKSCTAANIELQMRLGLGQVLHYAHKLRALAGQTVRPALALEIEPSADWMQLLDSLGVALLLENSLAADLARLLDASH